MVTKRDSITVVVTPRRKNGRLMLHEVQAHLQLLGEAIEAFGGPDTKVEVVSMSMNSPLRVILRPLREKTVNVDGQLQKKLKPSLHSIRAFEQAVAGLQGRGRAHESSDIMALHHLKRFVESGEANGYNSSVQTQKQEWEVQPSIIEDINRTLATLSVTNHWEETQVSGRLVRLNIASKIWTFTILPVAGAARVSCDFPPDLLPVVKDALDRFVKVDGVGQFKPGSSFPHRMKDIRITTLDDTAESPFLSLFTEISENALLLSPDDWELHEARRSLG